MTQDLQDRFSIDKRARIYIAMALEEGEKGMRDVYASIKGQTDSAKVAMTAVEDFISNGLAEVDFAQYLVNDAQPVLRITDRGRDFADFGKHMLSIIGSTVDDLLKERSAEEEK